MGISRLVPRPEAEPAFCDGVGSAMVRSAIARPARGADPMPERIEPGLALLVSVPPAVP